MENSMVVAEHVPEPSMVKKRIVKAKYFVAAFRKRPDDFYLMEVFELKPKHLKKLYQALMERGWLSEYEYLAREAKYPGLDELPELTAAFSTTVTIIEDSTVTEKPHLYGAQTGVEVNSRALAADTSTQERVQTYEEHASQDSLVPGACPVCGCRVHQSSPDECLACGIVFSKMNNHPRFRSLSMKRGDLS